MSNHLKTGVFTGRFQPFHQGHQACIKKILEQNDLCIVLLRNGAKDDKNPYDFEVREQFIMDWATKENIADKIMVTELFDPNYDLTFYYGRGVGYKIEELHMPKEIEEISATKIREAK